jgi:glycosyltransferase involved in cell wall biosynthesis
VPYEDVPALLGGAAVALLPHRVNDFTASMDPMKLLEYLASGLRVVSTPLPGMVDRSDRIVVVDRPDPRAFAAAVGATAALDRPGDPDPSVLARTWDAVAERLAALHLDGERP